jgi:hypothetical protein
MNNKRRIEIHEWSRNTALNWTQSSQYAARRFLKERGAKLKLKRYNVTDLYGTSWVHREYYDETTKTRYLYRIEAI